MSEETGNLRAEEILAALDNDQKAVALASRGPVCVIAGAGTGKTVLALEKASRLAGMGKRTLLLCYNAPLADHLKRIVTGIENLKCASFHSFCHETAAAAGIDMP